MQEPQIPPEEDTPIVVLTAPTLIIDPVNGMKVGATLGHDLGTASGTISSTTSELRKTNDDKATDSLVTGYVWGSGVPNHVGFKLFVRVTRIGPLNPGGVISDSALSEGHHQRHGRRVSRRAAVDGDWFLTAFRYPAAGSLTWSFAVWTMPSLGTVAEVRITGVDVGNYPTDEDLEAALAAQRRLPGPGRGRKQRLAGSRRGLHASSRHCHAACPLRVSLRRGWPVVALSDRCQGRQRGLDRSARIRPRAGMSCRLRTDIEASLDLKGGDQEQFLARDQQIGLRPIADRLERGRRRHLAFRRRRGDLAQDPDEGLRGYGMQGVLIDPQDPNRFTVWGGDVHRQSDHEFAV